MKINNLSSISFQRLVNALKNNKKTCTTIEQSCGGMISSSILAQPGASKVYVGGTIAYNTKASQKLLLNDNILYNSLLEQVPKEELNGDAVSSQSEADVYIQSKLHWTALTSIAYCKQMNTDYAIAEGGATGPTFRPNDMKTGFSVIAIAGRDPLDGSVSLLKQQVIHSTHSNRQFNMKLFANTAADIATSIIEDNTVIEDSNNDHHHHHHIDNHDKSTSTSFQSATNNKALQWDRATHLRTKKDELDTLQLVAQYVILQGSTQILIHKNNNHNNLNFELAFLDQTQLDIEFGGSCDKYQKTFLGMKKDDNDLYETPIFGIDIPKNDNNILSSNSMYTFVDTRTTAPLFTSLDNEIALHITGIKQWQKRTKFCSSCGSGSIEFVDGGTRALCNNCNATSYPRQDPSIIVLISSRDQQRVLLARSPRHPNKLHTVLAGFVEVGETFESAVAREAYEETGVIIDEDSIEYISSQPWPFPQSCMIGYIATADDTTPLIIDTNEIVTASWFHKDDVIKASYVQGATMQHTVANHAIENNPSLSLLIPPKGVIARKLIDYWISMNS